MKKIIALLLVLILAALPLTACKKKDGPLRVGYMTGPTGMGMAKLIHDNGGTDGNEKYTFEAFADTTAAAAALTAGKIDVICLPTNEAAKNYNTASPDFTVLAINCLNSLYVLVDSTYDIEALDELDGRTIYTCKNGTPAPILNYLLEHAGIDANVKYEIGNGEDETVIAKPQDIAPLLASGSVDIALAPEPIVTSALLTIKNNPNAKRNYKVISLDSVWNEISDTPVAMGCVVSTSGVISNNKAKIDAFLNDYKASIDYISTTANADSAADYIVEAGIMQAKGAAKTALLNLGDAICYLDGEDMKSALTSFYEVIGKALIGGRLPDDEFYYEK